MRVRSLPLPGRHPPPPTDFVLPTPRPLPAPQDKQRRTLPQRKAPNALLSAVGGMRQDTGFTLGRMETQPNPSCRGQCARPRSKLLATRALSPARRERTSHQQSPRSRATCGQHPWDERREPCPPAAWGSGENARRQSLLRGAHDRKGSWGGARRPRSAPLPCVPGRAAGSTVLEG